MKQAFTRNFCIIAHIDHGKSTLADRLIEKTALVSERQMKDQLLDDMDLEREKGITIKARSVCLSYEHSDKNIYTFNMIDTPGHVDFSYEVSRSLSSCEGALLVIDASQGIQAQTIVNTYLAQEQDLTIIPVINKVDLPNADPERILNDLEQSLDISSDNAILTSAKTGQGIDELLRSIVTLLDPPRGDRAAPLKALIFDSVYENYRGVIIFVRIFEGILKKGTKILLIGKEKEYDVVELGIFAPSYSPQEQLQAGDVGYVIANIKDVKDVRVGDTITTSQSPSPEALPGYKEIKPMVFSGFYPITNADYTVLKDALDKLKLNDASIFYEPESSTGIGFGFRCGFLGLLHMEIIQKRIEREFKVPLITTTPQVHYRAYLKSQEVLSVKKPAEMPDPTILDRMEEPYIKAFVILPASFMGAIIQLLQDRRGIYVKTEYLDKKKVILTYELPLAEVLNNFYDKLKSLSSGYASFDYEPCDYRPGHLVKLNILVNGECVDSLSVIVEKTSAIYKGRKLIEKLKELIPRQLFKIVIQAALGKKVIARAEIRAIQKNVTAKCYGGDITRKRKLLEKQKEGKKRMKQIGQVSIPSEAFISVLKIDS